MLYSIQHFNTRYFESEIVFSDVKFFNVKSKWSYLGEQKTNGIHNLTIIKKYES